MKTRKLLSALVLLACSLQLSLAGEVKMIRDEELDGIVDRAIVVPPGEFSLASVERLARAFLREKDRRYGLLRLTVGVSEGDVVRGLMHCCTPDLRNEFEYHLQKLKKEGLPTLPIARVIATRKGALLSYRDGRGLVERLISGTEDPTRIRAGGVDYRVLHFYIPRGSKTGDGLPHVAILLRASDLSMSSLLLVMKQLEQRIGVADVRVAARRTPWLLGLNQCPDVPRFEGPQELPNVLNGRFAPVLSCTQMNGEMSCSGDRFRP